MLDLNKFEQRVNRYGGSEEKRTYYKNGQFFLVKIPDKIREKNNTLSYMNNSFSEYISCHIFESVEIPVQETDLSILNINGTDKVVCVCKDFTDEETTLIEYCNSENDKIQNIYTENNQKSKELNIENILDTINNNEKIRNKDKIISSFWDVFIIDCLIYNRDRHNENWGFMENDKKGEISFAPVYDCGSALFALYSEEKCQNILNNPREFKNLALNSISAMKYDNKKIRYYEFISSMQNEDCNKALLRIFPKINLNKINSIIDSTPLLSSTYKSFYKEIIKNSYELILNPTYNILKSKEHKLEENIKSDLDDFLDYIEDQLVNDTNWNFSEFKLREIIDNTIYDCVTEYIKNLDEDKIVSTLETITKINKYQETQEKFNKGILHEYLTNFVYDNFNIDMLIKNNIKEDEEEE